MKYFGILLVQIFNISCFAQNSSNFLLANLNPPADINSCYKATPALVMQAKPSQLFFQSTDNGTTWIDLSIGLPDKIDISNTFVKDNKAYIGTRDGKLYCNTNLQTSNWEVQHLEGKDPGGFISGIYDGKSGIYACVIEHGFYRQVEGTDHWKPMHTNLADKNVHAVLETPDGTIWVGCSSGIYQSTDDGNTWNHSYAKGWINGLTYGSKVILANCSDGILRSADNGEHWTCVVNDVAAYYKITVIGEYFIAFREAGPWQSATEYKQSLLLSNDAGNTWQNAAVHQPGGSLIYDLEKVGDYLYASREAGISRSNDLGKTWQLLLAPPAGNTNNAMFQIITSGTQLFAFIRQGGC
jgi:photosystem II stability/assembly factor-like uncharacterized protein